MATPQQLEKKRSRQIEEILTAVITLAVEVTELKSEISELKDALTAKSPRGRPPKK